MAGAAEAGLAPRTRHRVRISHRGLWDIRANGRDGSPSRPLLSMHAADEAPPQIVCRDPVAGGHGRPHVFEVLCLEMAYPNGGNFSQIQVAIPVRV